MELSCVRFFFFSGRRRHTRYWRDWSSDVCSSDLGRRLPGVDRGGPAARRSRARRAAARLDVLLPLHPRRLDPGPHRLELRGEDWKSVVQGKRVDLGGRRIIKKKNKAAT